MIRFVMGLLVWMMLAVGTSFAERTGENPIFYLAFDGDIEPQGTIEVEKATGHGEIASYTAGIKGQSLVIGKGHVDYHVTPGALSAAQGTISLWIRPLDWDDESFIDFLNTYSYDPNLKKKWSPIFRIYRPYHYRMGLAVLKYASPDNISISYHRASLEAWQKKQGKWHQIVFTWKGAKGNMYIDGLEIGTHPQIADSLKEVNVIRIGNQSVKYPEGGGSVLTKKTTAIDEVVFYDHVLNPNQVRSAYEKFMGKLEKSDGF